MTQYETVRRLLLSTTGFDIGYYKPDQMKRILSTIMIRAGVANIEEYARLLRQDRKRVQEFKNYITINVSSFFRDKRPFDYFADTILPKLFGERREFEIWSAGCAAGEEAYSVAMLLEEKKPKEFNFRILGTDIDDHALDQAELGIYPEKSLKNVPKPYLDKYFSKTRSGFQVDPNLRARVRFQRHDLLTVPMLGRFNLILCRNVVIYFTEKYKERVYENVSRSLAPGGILFIGSTETLLNYRQFGLEKMEIYFYRKSFSQGESQLLPSIPETNSSH